MPRTCVSRGAMNAQRAAIRFERRREKGAGNSLGGRMSGRGAARHGAMLCRAQGVCRMKLAWLLWLASVLPGPTEERVCLAATVYLEARDQPELGQRAVAEVALRRWASKRGDASLCDIVKARKQFAPGIVSPNYRVRYGRAWDRAW